MGHPFLIVGTGSSGSHLLSILLDKHPELCCGPELAVFNHPAIYHDFARVRAELPRLLERGMTTGGWFNHQTFFENLHAYFHTPDDVVRLGEQHDTARALMDAFFARYLEERGATVWGEQTLSNVYCVGDFLELYPEGRIIHLVRDGRDVMCSLIRRGFFPYAAAARWLYDVSAGFAHRDDDRYIEVRYRDLVTEPKVTLQRACDHIGVDLHPDILSPDVENEYWATYMKSTKMHRSWKHTPSAATISTASVDRWKDELTDRHQALFWSVHLTDDAQQKLGVTHRTAHHLMRSLGFEDDPPAIPGASPRDLYGGLRMWLGRSRFELQFEGRLWGPLTQASVRFL